MMSRASAVDPAKGDTHTPSRMGDIYRKVKVRGVRPDGRRGPSQTLMALIATGATSSVISEVVARGLGGLRRRRADEIDGQPVDAMLASLKLLSRDCGERERLVVVSDRLAKKAGPKAQMILGSDYLQRTRAVLLFDRDGRDGIVCRRGGRKH
jgi:hypothetical protein